MAKAGSEEVLRLPLDLVTASVGITLDLGGSALKLLYRSKEDFKDGKPLKNSEDGLGPIRLAIWAKEDVSGLISFIQARCDLTPEKDGGRVFSSGMGGNMLKGVIEEKLQLTVVNSPEFPCLTTGVTWALRNVPKDQLFSPIHKEAETIATRIHKENVILAGPVMEMNVDADPDEFFSRRSENDPSYPFMLVLCGSAFLMIKISEDGSMEFLEACQMGGRFFLGMTSMLAGTRDHGELVDMMTSSDGRSVDLYTSEMTSSGADDSYSVFHENDINLFPMGKCNFKPREELKTGDLVHSFTKLTCRNLVQLLHNVANKAGLKKVYFCGNFVSPDFIKSNIAAEVMSRCIVAPKEDRIDIQFLRYGGHLVALGAFLKHGEL